MNKCFYESEARRIADLNEIFGEVELTEDEQRILIWLAGWNEYTIEKCAVGYPKSYGGGSKAAGNRPSVGRKGPAGRNSNL